MATRQQFIFTNKEIGITTILFKNVNSLYSIERIIFYKETGLRGNWLKKECRYSFDNIIWSTWRTLSQSALTSINFANQPNFFLEVLYTRQNYNTADITDFYLFYDSEVGAPGEVGAEGIDADTLQGEPGSYYLDRANHTGPYDDLIIDNVQDASIYPGVFDYRVDTSDGSEFYFKRIQGIGGITVTDVSGILTFDGSVSGGGGGDGIDGGVWITDINPTASGNVGDKVTSSDGNVLDSCLTDTTGLTVSILALPGHTNYKPIITINDVSISLSASLDKPLWTGTYPMTYSYSDASITVHHEDGASWSTTVDADTPAVILSANFIGSYPGSQTELKAGDTMQINVVTDVAVTSIEWDNWGAISSGSYSASGTNNTFTVTIADRGDTAVLRGFTLRVIKATGSTSLDYISTSHGSVELTDVVNCNNLYPSVSFSAVTYPASQEAIKSGESATIVNSITNYDSVLYSSPTGELTVSNTTTYENPKTATYLSGGYNITVNNIRAVAIRNANNSSTTGNGSIWIANTPATLSVSNPASRLRSGGNDGTVAQNHTITISASGQRLLSAPTLVKDTGGTWLGGGFSWSASATSFTRSLQVDDNDTKATYNWGAISGTNLAGIVTTTNSGTTTYVLGGFVVRTITLAAFGWQANINVEVSDYTKLSSTGSGQALDWTTATMNTRSTIGDITRPQASTWSASGTFTNPTTINILDKSATDSTSQASTFTIQEGI